MHQEKSSKRKNTSELLEAKGNTGKTNTAKLYKEEKESSIVNTPDTSRANTRGVHTGLYKTSGRLVSPVLRCTSSSLRSQ